MTPSSLRALALALAFVACDADDPQPPSDAGREDTAAFDPAEPCESSDEAPVYYRGQCCPGTDAESECWSPDYECINERWEHAHFACDCICPDTWDGETIWWDADDPPEDL